MRTPANLASITCCSPGKPTMVATTTQTESPGSITTARSARSEEHTSELQSLTNLVCRLLLEKKKNAIQGHYPSASFKTPMFSSWASKLTDLVQNNNRKLAGKHQISARGNKLFLRCIVTGKIM